MEKVFENKSNDDRVWIYESPAREGPYTEESLVRKKES